MNRSWSVGALGLVFFFAAGVWWFAFCGSEALYWSSHARAGSLRLARMSAAEIATAELNGVPWHLADSGVLIVDGGVRFVCVRDECAPVGAQLCVGTGAERCRLRSPVIEKSSWPSYDDESETAARVCEWINATSDARRAVAERCRVPFQNLALVFTDEGRPREVEFRCANGVAALSARGAQWAPALLPSIERRDGGATIAVNPAFADAGISLPECDP